jgi:hypothetical protein
VLTILHGLVVKPKNPDDSQCGWTLMKAYSRIQDEAGLVFNGLRFLPLKANSKQQRYF